MSCCNAMHVLKIFLAACLLIGLPCYPAQVAVQQNVDVAPGQQFAPHSDFDSVSAQLPSEEKQHVVVFDIGGVLLGASMLEICKRMGLGTCIEYMLWDRRSMGQMRQKYDEVLWAVPNDVPATMLDVPVDEKGKPLGGITFEQQAGTKTPHEIIQCIFNAISQFEKEGRFCGAREKTLIENMVQVIYNPPIFARCMKPIQQGVELLTLCAKNPKNKLMILSNMGAGTVEIFKQLYPEIFKYFKPEDIIASGDISEADRRQFFSGSFYVVKPNQEVFQYVTKLSGYDASKIIFIDDMKINCQAAEKTGWKALQVEHGNFEPVKKTLVQSGIILESSLRAQSRGILQQTKSIATLIATAAVCAGVYLLVKYRDSKLKEISEIVV